MADESRDRDRGGDVGDRCALLGGEPLLGEQETRCCAHRHDGDGEGGDLRCITSGAGDGFGSDEADLDRHGVRRGCGGIGLELVHHGSVHRVLLRVQEEPWAGQHWLVRCSCECQRGGILRCVLFPP